MPPPLQFKTSNGNMKEASEKTTEGAFQPDTPSSTTEQTNSGPMFSREKYAKKTANDINAIFYSKYQVEEAKTALSVEKALFRQKNHKYGLWDQYGWGEDEEYVTKEVWKLKPSESFDWETDRYTIALHDILTLSKATYVNMLKDSRRKPQSINQNENDYKWNEIYKYGGGEVTNYPTVNLSSKLLETKPGEKPSDIDYTIGGVFLHEYLYHLHPLGTKEDMNPQIMREHYNIVRNNHSISYDHESGDRNNRPYTNSELLEITERLNRIIEKNRNNDRN